MRIDRRQAMMAMGAGAAALTAGCAPNLSTLSAETSRNGARRRFLFIAVDDLRPMLGSYGAIALTPNLDALARQAISFDNAYVQVAVCGASRASLFTALRPETTGMMTYSERIEETVPDAASLHASFKQAGFKTFSYGKNLHFANDAVAGWSEPPVTMSQERAEGIDPKMQLVDSALDPASDVIWREDATRYGKARRQPAWEAADVPDGAYRDGRLVTAAIERLDRLAATDDPFLFMLGLYKPHLPFNAPRKYWDLYDRDAIPLPERDTMPAGAPAYSILKGGEITTYAGLPPDSNDFGDEHIRLLIHGYMACVSYMDAQVGRLMDALKANGLWDNLSIVVWGDHGYKLGDYRAWSKHSNMELDTRIPLIMRVPGLAEEGARSDAFVETVDLFPTLLDLATIPIPEGLQGRSIVPLLKRPDREWKSAVFSQFGRTVAGSKVTGYSVRTRQYRFTIWKDDESAKVLSRELYDHRVDPLEMRNVAENPDYSEIVERLERIREQGWSAIR
jgi:iduronate 2-sulfatase